MHGFDEALCIAIGRRIVAVGAFFNAPAIVTTLGDDIDFFPFVLADVACEKFTGTAIKANAPRIAETVGVDFRQIAGCSGSIGIVGGDAIIPFCRPVHIHAQDFAQMAFQILCIVLRVAAAAAVTGGNIKVAVLPELH